MVPTRRTFSLIKLWTDQRKQQPGFRYLLTAKDLGEFVATLCFQLLHGAGNTNSCLAIDPNRKIASGQSLHDGEYRRRAASFGSSTVSDSQCPQVFLPDISSSCLWILSPKLRLQNLGFLRDRRLSTFGSTNCVTGNFPFHNKV